MGQKHAIARLILLIVVSAGLTSGLYLLGELAGFSVNWSDPIAWYGEASPEEALGATIRIVGLAIGCWITISTLLYLGATMRRTAPRPRLVSLVTLPGIRSVVDRALATALTASVALSPLSPALAEQPQPAPVVFDISRDGVPVPHIQISEQPRQDEPGVVPMPESTNEPGNVVVPSPVPAMATSAQPVTAAAAGYTVQPGDSLWQIADRQVREFGDETTTVAVTAYWREVVSANRDTLRSGDPNLIFPGEIVTLPALETG